MALAALFLVMQAYLSLQSWAAVKEDSLEKRLLQQSENQSEFSDKERLALIAREVKALQVNPLGSKAIRHLALLAKDHGRQAQAEELLLVAANRSLRDLKAQADVLPILLAHKDFAGALYRLDGLFRSKPERTDELLKIAAAFAATPESRLRLVSVLAQNPPWRFMLMNEIAKKASTPTIAYSLLSDLRRTAAPPTRDEVRMVILRFIDDHNYETAYFVWLDFLTDRELRKVAQIFDGSFELDPNNMFFDWTFNPMKNVELRIVPRSSASIDRVLRIEFANTQDRFENLSQILRLAPGSYLFSGEAKPENLRTEAGLVWKFYCLGNQVQLLTEAMPFPQQSEWTHFEKEIIVPPDACRTQLLRLEVNSRAILDQRISGRILYDDLKLIPRKSAQQ
jgi:hypothetical protein